MKHCLKRSFYFSFLLFFLGLSNWDKVYAAEPCTWIETTENVAKLGLEKIWFAPDLNKAVFLRSGKLQNKKPDFNASAVKQLDNKMAHINNTFYFYNMDFPEIYNWSQEYYSQKTANNWKIQLGANAQAQSSDCTSKAPTLPSATGDNNFFKSFVNVVNGDFLKKMVGCSTQENNDQKKNEELSVENFSAMLKEHWELLKEVFTQLPSMDLPEITKDELMCEGVSLAIYMAQGAALAATGIGVGAGAYIVSTKLILAFKKILGLAKNLKKTENKKILGRSPHVNASSKVESEFLNKKKYIEDLQRDSNKILDEVKTLKGKRRANAVYMLKVNLTTELKFQKDALESLQKLKAAGASVDKQMMAANNRIAILSKLRITLE